MDRDQIRAVALDNACRMTASGLVHSTDVLEVAARFETWLTRDVPSTSTSTDTVSTSTDTAPCLGCEHAPHVGRCPKLLKGPFGPWRCACDLDTSTDTVSTTVTSTGTLACSVCGHAPHGGHSGCDAGTPAGPCACDGTQGTDTACAWNPAMSSPDCDWSRDCPVHGTPDTDAPLGEWGMCACGHAGVRHSVTGYGCQGVIGHRPCKCPKRGTLVSFGKLPDADTDRGVCAGCFHAVHAGRCTLVLTTGAQCACTRPGGN